MTTELAIERPKKGVRYDIEKLSDESHRLTRVPKEGDIEVVANVKDGVITYASDAAQKYEPVIKRRLNENGIPYEGAKPVVVADPPEQKVLTATPAPEATDKPLPPPPMLPVQKKKEADPTWDGLTIDQRKAVYHLRNSEGLPTEVETDGGECPPNGKAGDKAPEVVNWYLRYKPATFAVKYGIVRLGSIPATRTEKDPETRKDVLVHYTLNGVVARRKTHLTLLDPIKKGGKK